MLSNRRVYISSVDNKSPDIKFSTIEIDLSGGRIGRKRAGQQLTLALSQGIISIDDICSSDYICCFRRYKSEYFTSNFRVFSKWNNFRSDASNLL